jgi:endonuclease G
LVLAKALHGSPLQSLLLIGAGALGGYALAHELQKHEPQRRLKGQKQQLAAAQPPSTPVDLQRLVGGAPPSRVFHRVSDHYASEFDTQTRNPRWVCERLTRENTTGEASRANMSFKEEPGLPPALRSRLSDFAGWRYDRGHMAPAANHRNSEVAMADTFYLSNISPQVGTGFNRDYWARFEKMTRDLLRHHETLYVVTGPLFLPEWDPNPPPAPRSPKPRVAASEPAAEPAIPAPEAGLVIERPKGRWVFRNEAIGDALHWVSVPTHFYKVVLAADSLGRARAVGAFVMPNDRIPAETPLHKFIVPLSAVEGAAGLQFFRDLLPPAGEADAAAVAGAAAEADARLVPVFRAEEQLVAAALPSGDRLPRSLLQDNTARIFAKGFPSGLSPDVVPQFAVTAASPGDATAGQPSSPKARASPRTPPSAVSVAAAPAALRIRHICSVGEGCGLPAENWFAEAVAAKAKAGAGAGGTQPANAAAVGQALAQPAKLAEIVR